MSSQAFINVVPDKGQRSMLRYTRLESRFGVMKKVADRTADIDEATLKEFEAQCRKCHISPAQALAFVIARVVQEEKENARLAGEDE